MRQTPTQQTQQQRPRTTENPTPSPSAAGAGAGSRTGFRLALAVVLLSFMFSLSFTSCKNGSSGSEAGEGCGLEGCKIVAPDPGAADTFGFAVAADGDKMVAGSIVDTPAPNAGAAYVFAYDDGEWIIEQKIQATTPLPDGGDLFGGAVAIQGDRIAVGAQGLEPVGGAARAGGVFIFDHDGDTWSQVQQVLAPDFALDDYFGVSVDLDGDWLVVGAHLDDDSGSASGSVYVFEHDGSDYVFDQKLSMSQHGADDRLGIDVAIDDDIIVAGAHQDNLFGVGVHSGSAAVYRYDGTDWSQEQTLLGGTFAAGEEFGISVDVSEEVIIVGAHLADGSEEDAGRAWVYRFDGAVWSIAGEVEQIEPSDPAKSKLFGYSVSIEGDRVVVGAQMDDAEGQRAGAAYVFEYEGGEWVEQHKLTAPDATTGDYFGGSVSLSGDAAVIGAPEAGPGDDASGAAYGFEL